MYKLKQNTVLMLTILFRRCLYKVYIYRFSLSDGASLQHWFPVLHAAGGNKVNHYQTFWTATKSIIAKHFEQQQNQSLPTILNGNKTNHYQTFWTATKSIIAKNFERQENQLLPNILNGKKTNSCRKFQTFHKHIAQF